MAQYQLQLIVTDSNINTVKNKLKEALRNVTDASFQVEKIETDKSRAQRLSEAESEFESAKGVVEDLRDEMQEWYDNMPENFQSGSKGDDVQSAVEALEEIISNMEQVDFSGVDFPSMM